MVGVAPPPIIPRVDDDTPPAVLVPVVKSPKSCAFPVDAIVT